MTEPAFLNVETSCTGRRWEARPYDERMAEALAQRLNLPDLVARSLNARGIDVDDAEDFLNPKLRSLMPDPNILKDMDKAVSRFVRALSLNERIAVFGDYDVDGATSAALLLRLGRAMGVPFRLYIPDRLTEGYGPNAHALQKLAQEGVKLVVCVDCGTTAHDALAAARKSGMDVLVLDHHVSEPTLPLSEATVNPNRIDETSGYNYLAAVGVTYLFIVAVNRALRAMGFYNTVRPEPDLMAWLDLVALGTVCDVVPLRGLNRAFVAQGLKIATRRKNIGLDALAKTAGVDTLNAYAFGFMLGPRINAGGRIGQTDLGARLLSTEDPSEAISLAHQLNVLNDERRALEADALQQAELMIETENAPLAFVASENWHPGIIGIVASRLKDKCCHPALVVSLEGDVGKGSGRSIGSIDLGAAILAARQAGLLINGGGHKMAAGFTVARDKIEALRLFLIERIGKQLAAEPLIPRLSVDGLVSGATLQPDFVRLLEKIGPFGTGNTEPRLALADCKIVRADVVGEKHVSILAMQAGTRIRGIAFRAMDSRLGPALLNIGARVHLAGHARINTWQGAEHIQMHINDAAPSINPLAINPLAINPLD
ncbi:MAG: single-stranded-DNA-specific exonuclease RecJ [Alphaproteobacteria bacterium]|nr:single-stranded-DNA-specific exonuclease RecJ [Alphaproteobacteria bacterium]